MSLITVKSVPMSVPRYCFVTLFRELFRAVPGKRFHAPRLFPRLFPNAFTPPRSRLFPPGGPRKWVPREQTTGPEQEND